MRTKRVFKVKWKAFFINFKGLSATKNCLITDLTLDHVFHGNIIAYCQQNRCIRLAVYTDLFTLKTEIISSVESIISTLFQKELNTLKDKCEKLMQNSYSDCMCQADNLRKELKTKTKLLANSQQHIKETRNSYFCVTPKNYWLMFVSWKY